MTTSKRIAPKAARQLRNSSSTKDQRAVAGSDLSQVQRRKKK